MHHTLALTVGSLLSMLPWNWLPNFFQTWADLLTIAIFLLSICQKKPSPHSSAVVHYKVIPFFSLRFLLWINCLMTAKGSSCMACPYSIIELWSLRSTSPGEETFLLPQISYSYPRLHSFLPNGQQTTLKWRWLYVVSFTPFNTDLMLLCFAELLIIPEATDDLIPFVFPMELL